MKKGILYLATGLIMGLALSVAVPAFGAAKQYVLTLFERPVIVNGKTYNDTANPILNHNGKTYIPLAKIGELTGVQYKWNADKKQVEIGAAPKASTSGTSGPAGRENDYLKPDTVIEKEAQKGYRGFSDSVDPEFAWADVTGDPLPPRLSEGWISEKIFYDVYSLSAMIFKDEFIVTTPNMAKPKELLRVTLPAGWNEKTSGEAVADGIRIKKFNELTYFNISDIEKTGIVN